MINSEMEHSWRQEGNIFLDVYKRQILRLLKEIKDMDISQLLDVIRKLKDDNTDIKECLDFMQMWYRDILMYKTTKDLNLLIFKDEFSAVKKAASLSSYEAVSYTHLDVYKRQPQKRQRKRCWLQRRM